MQTEEVGIPENFVLVMEDSSRNRWKCDRGRPCGTCAHRGLSQSCSYIRPEVTDQPARNQPSLSTSIDMRVRVRELEALVISLRITLSAAKPTTLHNPEPSHHEGAQWTAILDRVRHIQYSAITLHNCRPNETTFRSQSSKTALTITTIPVYCIRYQEEHQIQPRRILVTTWRTQIRPYIRMHQHTHPQLR